MKLSINIHVTRRWEDGLYNKALSYIMSNGYTYIINDNAYLLPIPNGPFIDKYEFL